MSDNESRVRWKRRRETDCLPIVSSVPEAEVPCALRTAGYAGQPRRVDNPPFLGPGRVLVRSGGVGFVAYTAVVSS